MKKLNREKLLPWWPPKRKESVCWDLACFVYRKWKINYTANHNVYIKLALYKKEIYSKIIKSYKLLKKKKCNYTSVTMILDFPSQLLQSNVVKTWSHVFPSQMPTFKIRRAQLSMKEIQVTEDTRNGNLLLKVIIPLAQQSNKHPLA